MSELQIVYLAVFVLKSNFNPFPMTAVYTKKTFTLRRIDIRSM